MVAFDASFAMLALRPAIPASVDHAKDRVVNLLIDLQKAGERIVIPTPALTEFLVHAEAAASEYLDELQKSARFKIAPYGLRAAVEVAVIIEAAITKKDKRDGSRDRWAKVNFDRQIAAIAKVEGAHTIYSDDKDLGKFAVKMGMRVVTLADLPVPPSKTPLFDNLPEEEVTPVPPPPEESKDHDEPKGTKSEEGDKRKTDSSHPSAVQGSDGGRAQGEAAGEARQETAEAKTGEVIQMLKKGDYVRMKAAPQTRMGTIEGSRTTALGNIECLFRLDPRYSEELPDFYLAEDLLEQCPRGRDEDITAINQELKNK
jgi:predicted nucleic acid-binding protein